jgi:hypothetical protein
MTPAPGRSSADLGAADDVVAQSVRSLKTRAEILEVRFDVSRVRVEVSLNCVGDLRGVSADGVEDVLFIYAAGRPGSVLRSAWSTLALQPARTLWAPFGATRPLRARHAGDALRAGWPAIENRCSHSRAYCTRHQGNDHKADEQRPECHGSPHFLAHGPKVAEASSLGMSALRRSSASAPALCVHESHRPHHATYDPVG